MCVEGGNKVCVCGGGNKVCVCGVGGGGGEQERLYHPNTNVDMRD